MTDQAQLGSDAPVIEQAQVGTTDGGQPEQSTKPSDGEMMRASYTQKTQELAEQRRMLDKEKQDFESQRQQFQSQYSQHLPQNHYQQPQYQVDPLEEQFGADGARAVKSLLDSTKNETLNETRNTLYQIVYNVEEEKGKSKYGDEWNKHYYTDQFGNRKHKVMDYRHMIDPRTNGTLTMEQAWIIANPPDLDKIRQETIDKTYSEQGQKAQNTPTQGGVAPSGGSSGTAKSIAEAFAQAESQYGVKS
ncbi:MAG: hypothetical protein AB7P94_17410 [Steroidobacteraceae bacterium]